MIVLNFGVLCIWKRVCVLGSGVGVWYPWYFRVRCKVYTNPRTGREGSFGVMNSLFGKIMGEPRTHHSSQNCKLVLKPTPMKGRGTSLSCLGEQNSDSGRDEIVQILRKTKEITRGGGGTFPRGSRSVWE